MSHTVQLVSGAANRFNNHEKNRSDVDRGAGRVRRVRRQPIYISITHTYANSCSVTGAISNASAEPSANAVSLGTDADLHGVRGC